jgi:hypothetical protein
MPRKDQATSDPIPLPEPPCECCEVVGGRTGEDGGYYLKDLGWVCLMCADAYVTMLNEHLGEFQAEEGDTDDVADAKRALMVKRTLEFTQSRRLEAEAKRLQMVKATE